MNSIPVTKFGKDHWTLLAYADTRHAPGNDCVCTLDHRDLRRNEAKHPLPQDTSRPQTKWREWQSSRLAGYFESGFANTENLAAAEEAGVIVLGHDDWDCLSDLMQAGYIEISSIEQGIVQMTKEGFRVANLLRKHKEQGGMYAKFTLPQ
jgi:hypothetical protein